MSILITSLEEDQSTSDVIEWIHYFKNNVYRINKGQKLILDSIEVSNNEFYFDLDGEKISFNDVHSFWHRNANINFEFPDIQISDSFPFKKDLRLHLRNEERKLSEYYNHQLRQKKNIGNIIQSDLNKIVALRKAKDLAINIPPTLITTKKHELVRFKAQFDNVICKPISDGLMLNQIGGGTIVSYVNLISDELISELNDSFTVSLFQQKIEKKYELRIFYLHGDFYAMAIFSQADKKTSIDFRKYNIRKPNRTVPFNLPSEIKEKLYLLMQNLELNTGSIDMAVDLNNNYVFFEVNPVGQFGMTSKPCNYFLEKKIAEFLIK